ncbi:MAG: hypothetical protein Q9217_000177 [Psora testacea]
MDVLTSGQKVMPTTTLTIHTAKRLSVPTKYFQLYYVWSSGTIVILRAYTHDQRFKRYYKHVPALVDGVLTDPGAIPNGMKIISSNAIRRNFTLPVPDPPLPWAGGDATQEALEQKAIGFNYLGGKAPEASLYRYYLPDKAFLDTNCPGGLLFEVLFPICWNGKDLESSDFKSHVAYSDAGAGGGNCPLGFNHVINQIFLETFYNVAVFKDRNGFFAFANGDPTGYGGHGNVFTAWEEGILAAATEQCGPITPGSPGADGITANCPVFDMNPVVDQ